MTDERLIELMSIGVVSVKDSSNSARIAAKIDLSSPDRVWFVWIAL